MMERIELPSGRLIHVFDDVFTFTQREMMYEVVKNIPYYIQGGSTTDIQNFSDVALQSMFTYDQYTKFGLLYSKDREYMNLIKQYQAHRFYSLLMNYSLKPHYHTDTKGVPAVTLLYYANLEWNPDWGGETMFTDDTDLNKIVYTSAYKPGRVVLFDSEIPHKACPPSFHASHYRFTVVANMQKS